MHLPGALVFLATLAPLASAIPVFSSPAAAASLPGGTSMTVEWKDDGTAPAIADLASYQLFLYSGSGTAPTQLYAAASNGVYTTGNSATVTIPVGVGGSTTNAYFFGLMSTATAGGTITTYSSRFTLTGMTGTFPAAVITANAAVTDTSPPATVNNVVDAGSASSTHADGNFGLAYTLQTGLTRYAPMQPVPPTAITKTATIPLNPTSAVQFATTFLSNPSAVTTLTESQTFSVSSRANTAATQSSPTPSNDMQRFLNRWKD
ncbi:Cell wall synthesis protein [Lachnellula occidentalis]|uniref:Cell wall synthesis protein n=1 Tax=Lachnellula occidentalis TaxID=215460 RepID=A0A8H8S2P7_9HELO|nr:Cell wall synthesis protein [Lachnellula occidentalis]